MGIYDSVRGKVASSSKSEVSSKHVSTDENLSNNISSLRKEGGILQSSVLRIFNYKELKMATRNFHPLNLLGESGFGKVFKGHICKRSLIPSKPGTDMVIAVKILNQTGVTMGVCQVEVKYLGQFYHPHIVKLIGYCLEDERHFLVYEFMPQGSLDHYLFGRSSDLQPLSWSIRMKVALGIAKALAFLHSTEINVIHRGFCTSNILLDSEYNAKLSGFGLAIDGPAGDESYIETCVVGTYGYAAPECLATGYLSAKCNVYSFGVVLLEMLCGQRAIDASRASGKQNLGDWAKSYLGTKRKIFCIIDNCLQGKLSKDKAYKVAALVLRCISTEEKLRPNMDEIVAVLDQLQESVL